MDQIRGDDAVDRTVGVGERLVAGRMDGGGHAQSPEAVAQVSQNKVVWRGVGLLLFAGYRRFFDKQLNHDPSDWFAINAYVEKHTGEDHLVRAPWVWKAGNPTGAMWIWEMVMMVVAGGGDGGGEVR